jgi:hypothetical protein
MRGGESMAEDDKDQTISSSSENESLGHLVLGGEMDDESMSSDEEEDKEVDMV